MCTPYIESQKIIAMATSLRYRVSAISAFCRPTIQTASITNRLIAIVHTKPVIAILVPKLVAMATSLSATGPPSNTIPTAHPSPQPKQHLDRFSRFCTDDCRMSLYFTTGCPFPPSKLPLPTGGIWIPSNTWFLGPPKSSTQTASQSVQPFLQGSLV